MKKSSFFAGMLTMLLILGLGGTAFAAAYQKQATLNYQGIKITLDGEEITPKDGAGNVVEPFTIDGTTYLPVRAISNALGLGVDWDGETNTVEIAAPVMGGNSSYSPEASDGVMRLAFYQSVCSAAHYLSYEFGRIKSGAFDKLAGSSDSPLYAYFHGDTGRTQLDKTKDTLSRNDAGIEIYEESWSDILDEKDLSLIKDYKELSDSLHGYISAFESGTKDEETYGSFFSSNGMVLSDMLYEKADEKFLEMIAKRKSWLYPSGVSVPEGGAPVNTGSPDFSSDEWADYTVCDCYGDFSVPSLENIVGPASLVDIYYLDTGDSVSYTYELKSFKVKEGTNFAEEYFSMLRQYGFEHEKSEDGKVYFRNNISGITVAMYMPDDLHFSVLLMNVD